jgi:surfeit locus 1 family protein
MQSRTLLSLLIPLAAAVLFIRLGLWQTSRHRERAAVNVGLAGRLVLPPVPFDSLPRDTLGARWRRVTIAGRFRYDLEQVHAGRSSEGSPGVHLLTPLERDGRDTLVIVTRGWVYSGDAAAVDTARWREAETVRLEGYVLPLDPSGPQPVEGRALRALSVAALSARTGRPVAPLRIVMTSDSAARADSVPRRLPPPTIDGGPHLSYAIQWFAFALIAVVGGALLFRRGIVADRAGR